MTDPTSPKCRYRINASGQKFCSCRCLRTTEIKRTTERGPIGALAQGVLDARASWPQSTLADLYDPDLMPPNLRKAHNTLDLAVDRLYRKAPFTSERERVEHLFGLYEKLVAPIEAAAKVKVRKKKA